MATETQSLYKNKLLSIYKDLDALNVDEVQSKIDEIKDEISTLIKQCDESEEEKESVLINDFIKDDKYYQPIQPRTKTSPPEIIEQGKDEHTEYTTSKDLIVFLLLVTAVIGAAICLFFI